MDNKIVIELIKKDIEELRMLFGAIEGQAEPSDLIIDICKSKANVLLQEISLLGNEKKEDVSDYKPDDLVSTESAHAEIVQKEDSEVIRTIVETRLETAEDKKGSDLKQEEVNVSDEYISTGDEVDKMDLKQSGESKDPITNITTANQIEREIEVDTPIVNQEIGSEEISAEPEVDSRESEQDIAESTPKQSSDVSEKNNGNGKVLGESFIKEPSLNERFANLAHKQSKFAQKPISNLKKAIGINDRFLFTRELFENNMGKFEAAIDVIDGSDDLSKAISYLEDNFKWKKNEASLKFIDLVKRRFNN
jgi:hypothetical protein